MIAPPTNFQALIGHRRGRGSSATRTRDLSGSFPVQRKMSSAGDASPNVVEKILQYETFINEVLKTDLQ